MKQYWLTLFSDTFLWMEGNKGCVYNTVNFRQVRFEVTESLRELLNPLMELDNLYQLTLDEEQLARPEVRQLVEAVVETQSGSLVLNDGVQECPVSMFPELRIQDDLEDYQWEHERQIDGKIIHNLHRLIFYINGSANGSPDYFRQTIYPVVSGEHLDMEKICTFVANGSKSDFLKEVSLVGNLWKYPNYPKLLERLEKMGFRILVYVTAKDMLQNAGEARRLEEEGIFFHILVAGEADEKVFLREKIAEKENYTFVIASEEEYDGAIKYMEQYGLDRADMVPVYTGSNLPFFEECIFLTPEEIAQMALSKREIFIRQALNLYSFGILSVMPDGKVYANLNLPPVGEITEPPHDVVYRELTEGKSWLGIRDREPCKSCINRWLCPSPSNYEWVIGRPDLCHVNHV